MKSGALILQGPNALSFVLCYQPPSLSPPCAHSLPASWGPAAGKGACVCRLSTAQRGFVSSGGSGRACFPFQPSPSWRQWSTRSFPGRIWMERARWPCRWQVNAHTVSNVSSPSSLWLEASWRALSDKMHFPSQTSFLHSGWFLALAANIPHLWWQFYFRFHFCQQCCVLELDFGSWAKQILKLFLPTLCLLLGSWEQGDACMLSCPIPQRLIFVTLQPNHRPGFLLCPLLPWHVLASCWLFSGLVHSYMQREQLEKAFFFWVGESSILHNLSPFSASPHQIAILGSHVTCNKAPFHHRNMPINKFYIFFSSAAHHRSNFSK